MDSKKIALVSSDMAYNDKLKELINEVSLVNPVEYRFIQLKKGEIYTTFLNVLDFRPDIILLDLTDSKINSEELLGYIQSNIDLKRRSTSVLVSSIDDHAQVQEIYMKGADLIFTKDNDIKIILGLAGRLVYGVSIVTASYAVAKIDKEDRNRKDVQVKNLGKVSFVHEEAVGVESGLNINRDNIGLLGFDCEIFKKIGISGFTNVARIIAARSGHKSFGNYINLDISYDPDLPKIPKKRDFQFWIADHMNEDHQKFVEVLIVDKGLSFYKKKNSQILTKTYKINTLAQFSNEFPEIRANRPNMIIFQVPESDESVQNDLPQEGEQSPEEGVETINGIIKAIKDIPKYNPILVILNCKSKRSYDYTFVMTNESTLFDIDLASFIDVYRNSQRYKNYYFVSKMPTKKYALFLGIVPKAFLWLSFNIEVIFITECEFAFYCESIDISKKSVLYVDQPYDIFLTIMPAEKEIKGYQLNHTYLGLINAATDEERKRLRLLVNDLIFSPLQEKRDQEQKELEEKKQQALKVKEGGDSEGEGSEES